MPACKQRLKSLSNFKENSGVTNLKWMFAWVGGLLACLRFLQNVVKLLFAYLYARWLHIIRIEVSREFGFDISQPRFVNHVSVEVTVGINKERRCSNLSALLSRTLPFEITQPIGIVSLVRVNKFLAFEKSEHLLAFVFLHKFFNAQLWTSSR